MRSSSLSASGREKRKRQWFHGCIYRRYFFKRIEWKYNCKKDGSGHWLGYRAASLGRSCQDIYLIFSLSFPLILSTSPKQNFPKPTILWEFVLGLPSWSARRILILTNVWPAHDVDTCVLPVWLELRRTDLPSIRSVVTLRPGGRSPNPASCFPASLPIHLSVHCQTVFGLVGYWFIFIY